MPETLDASPPLASAPPAAAPTSGERTTSPARWPLRAMALLLASLGVVPMANLLTLAERLRWWPVAVVHWVLWGLLVGGAAYALARLSPAWCNAQRRRALARLLAPSPRAFAIAVALLTGALAVFFSRLLFDFQPVTIDELSEQWQAHILTTGRLVARAEPRGEFFSTMQTVSRDGRWFSHFPIGGPAIQAIGLLLHLPWLINPLLAAIAGVAVYRFTRAVGTEAQARLTALLFALSPFVLFTAASRLDHVGTLAAVWIALAALPRWHAATSAHDAARAAAVVGLGLGVATMIRPYDGLLVTIAVGVFQLVTARGLTHRWRSLAVQAVAGAVPIACLLAANRAMTGHALTFAYDILNGPAHRPGFHLNPLGFEHTPRHGLYAISTYLMRLDVALMAWPVPVVGVTALVMWLQRRASRWDALLVALLASTLTGYFLYWGEGSFNGPRFLYTVGPVFLVYLARLGAVVRDATPRPRLRMVASMLVPLWLAIAWLAPRVDAQPFGVWTLAGRAAEGEALTPIIARAVRERGLTHAVVFVNDGWHARLTARLRTLGATPFFAQLMVGHFDACEIQQRLDDAERRGLSPRQQSEFVFALLDAPPSARPVQGLSAMEQLALVPGRDLPPECQVELDRAFARGADMARLLPMMPLDSLGRLGGDVIFARDFGARNELLRDRFGDRAWYVVRTRPGADSMQVVLEPYRPPNR